MPRPKANPTAAGEAELVKRLRSRGPLSRSDLARELRLAPSTVGLYADRLLRAGYLREEETATAEPGRPPRLLTLDPGGGVFLGVDVEARAVRVCTVDFAQRVLRTNARPVRTPASRDAVLRQVEEEVAAATAAAAGPVLGIGVAAPGPVDPESGVARSYAYIAGWRDVPIAERLRGRFGMPVRVENNIRAIAFAELWFGQGRGVPVFLCLGVRSGVGACLMADGQLYRGADDLAGEIGAWPCTDEAGGVRRLEDVASVRAILRQLGESVRAGERTRLRVAGRQAEPDLAEAVAAACDGDPLARRVFERAARVHGRAMAPLTLMLNPAKIVVAGPPAELGEVFLAPLREEIAAAVPLDSARLPAVVASDLGEFAGAVGGAAAAVHHWRPAR